MRYGKPPGPPPAGVEATAQVDLLALVSEVAARVGVAQPDVVLLTGHGVIRSWASRRRRVLLVGLPLLQCLTTDEIRALVAHELAVVDHHRAHLVVRLRTLHDDAVEPGLPRGRSMAVLRATQHFADALERKADQAASSASGLHTAARAVVKADLAEFEFADLAFDLEEQVWQRTSAAIQDLHAGWQAAVRTGAVVVELDDDTRTTLMARHPGLAGAIAALTAIHVALRTTEAVPLTPLSPETERSLARQVLKREGTDWVTFGSVSDAEWPGWLGRQARAVTEQVATLLRRPPIGPAEVVEVLLTRLDELVAANWPAQPEPPAEPEELDGTPSVVVVAEATLTARGWRRVHPAAAGVLVSPDGEQHNLTLLARAAHDSPAALAVLLELLSRSPDL
ncbi:hypothetical protein GCM10010399_04840 [Dactylosporangium fulvum]|uniref:Uncharacterized protein n=1 Tax=Dactylosporangium fulvum TaxID=53359 RepID=A0ABY5VW50_9ACTN|nr:hypothetical protein [Dactylosporangium fulvum]UWP81336.1 hypothetical protein Dfulv_40470 [Dactylosporangium fulvum]